MMNLLELFSTDRKLLDTRGSLIIRQLCLNLNNERIYRTFAEILEKEEVRCPLHREIDIAKYVPPVGLGLRKHDGPQTQHDSDHFARARGI